MVPHQHYQYHLNRRTKIIMNLQLVRKKVLHNPIFSLNEKNLQIIFLMDLRTSKNFFMLNEKYFFLFLVLLFCTIMSACYNNERNTNKNFYPFLLVSLYVTLVLLFHIVRTQWKSFTIYLFLYFIYSR